MATSHGKAAPVGSTQWIQNERDHAGSLVEQEVEEYGYSVRNELEWLNEHMAEIFSQNNVNFADIFKTPGKLRGKTPRTARKRDPMSARQPLTDIFGPSLNMPPPPVPKETFNSKIAQVRIAADTENLAPATQDQRPSSKRGSPKRAVATDSGYHGMTEDEYDTDARTEAAPSSQQSMVQMVPLRENQPPAQRIAGDDTIETGPTTDESFMSAKEDLSSRNNSHEIIEEAEIETRPEEDEMEVDEPVAAVTPAPAPSVNDKNRNVDDQIMEDVPASPHSESSPEQPLQRKSSFTFSALPAREPLTAKRSVGVRDIQMEANRNSTLARSFGGKGASITAPFEDEPMQDRPVEMKAPGKTSTQLLQERINMLGKTKEPRPTKSIPSLQAVYPQLPSAEAESAHEMRQAAPAHDEEDDWIAPSKSVHGKLAARVHESSPRPVLHQKSISTTVIPSPSKDENAPGLQAQKAASISNVSLAHAEGVVESTTPAGSPMAKREGQASASKSRLWSAFKTAKSLFASSASASAAAKLEAHKSSPATSRSPVRDALEEMKGGSIFNMPGALFSEQQLPPSPTRQPSVKTTRSSSENAKKRERELKAQQKAADELEKAREKERKKAAKEEEARLKLEQTETAKKEKEMQKAAERPRTGDSTHSKEGEQLQQSTSRSILTGGKLRAPGRLMRPTKNEQAAKPAPVSIRVASQSQRMGQGPSQSTLSKSQHEGSVPPSSGKTAGRPGSAQGSVRSSTAQSNSRVKALEAAARKKEADEKAAQKKLEQKRELERKRAAKAEEERRAEEERKAAEQQRLLEAKQAAQRKAEQAAEAKKREQQRQLELQRQEQQRLERQRMEQRQEQQRLEQQRLEQQRQQQEAEKGKAAHDLAEAIKRERAAQQSHSRNDVGGTIRQLAKAVVPSLPNNNVKAPKRIFPEDEAQQPPQRPGMQRGPPSYQQNEAKRRRTNEEQDEQHERPSVMAPPKRPSNMVRKESTLSKFPHGYTHAPPPAAHHTSMFKATVTGQHQLQHHNKLPAHPSQTVQMSNARIPFAENVNPPAGSHPSYGQMHASYEHGNKYKTPARPAQMAPKSAAKSSPMYPKGDNIELPEIQTDSEEEDSEDEGTGGFRMPSWVASPALRDLLTQQQLVDPESVFGPIGELKMEEVFKNGKQDRLKRFRDRGSSAMWVESGDAVTSAEKRKDMQARERVAREGGWRFEPAH